MDGACARRCAAFGRPESNSRLSWRRRWRGNQQAANTVKLIFIYNLFMRLLYNQRIWGGREVSDYSIVAIIPLYNGAKWIEGAIRSVFAQTRQPDEFIVVDDGSTDGGAGAAIVEKLAQKRPIRLLRKENGRQSAARNFGVARSTSALIALLDQDDEWYSNHLDELVKPYYEQRDRPLALSYSHLSHVDEKGLVVRRRFLDGWSPKQTLVECLASDMGIQPSATLMSRKAFDAVGGFDESLSCYEDDDLFLRFFRAGYDMAFVNKICSFWRIHNGSCMHSDNMWMSIRLYMDKQLCEFPEYKDLIVRRFFMNAIHLHLRSLKAGAPLKQSIAFMREIAPLLPLRHRLILAGGAPFLQTEKRFEFAQKVGNAIRYGAFMSFIEDTIEAIPKSDKIRLEDRYRHVPKLP
jgi:glycosyltransferase involved in cell wall biosynthesis